MTAEGWLGKIMENGNTMQNDPILMQLQELVVHPREDLGIEIKGWLDLSKNNEDKAALAQALMAMANHGGGFVVIGFSESNGTWASAGPRPADLSNYSQDDINGIVQAYADPPFHCQVHQVSHPSTGEVFPVIVIPGGHRVPIRAKRDGPNLKHVKQNTYYIRRPGPKSEQPQSGREWDDLIARCVKSSREGLLEAIRDILHGGPPPVVSSTPQQRLARWEAHSIERWKQAVEERYGETSQRPLPKSYWTAAYSLGDIEKQKNLREFRQILWQVQGHETGWPVWLFLNPTDMAPYAYQDTVECLVADPRKSPAYADFWRASPEGLMFLVRGYEEDESEKFKPGTIVDVALPIWRVGECLLHAGRLAEALTAGQSHIAARFAWRGLRGRILSSLDPMRYVPRFAPTCRQDKVDSETVVEAGKIPDALAEIVHQITSPLYQAFEFFELSNSVINSEIRKLRQRG